jgi:hypothetical protein
MVFRNMRINKWNTFFNSITVLTESKISSGVTNDNISNFWATGIELEGKKFTQS